MIKRSLYLEKIRPFMNKDLIKVLTGIRRSGKSVMLELIRQELLESGIPPRQMIVYNFESMQYAHLCTASALYKDVLDRVSNLDGKVYLFFDEIQNVEKWEQCINSFRIDFDCDIYITGSNARLLSGELATYLSGRYVEFPVYPFSFQEYIACLKENECFVSNQDAFYTYLRLGGMPPLVHYAGNETESLQLLDGLYNTVILKDVISRNQIRNVDLLERIILYLAENIGRTFSATSISKYFKSEGRKIAPETILNYIRMCENAFLFYRISREDLSGKKILSVNEKYYLVDPGFREYLFGKNQKDIELILENMICIELLRRGYRVQIGKLGDREIDFVARRQNQTAYFQVCYLLGDEKTRTREFSAFSGIEDNYPRYVLSLDQLDFSQNGIIHRNIIDFLLEKEDGPYKS